jgi:two-component system, NtrC family, sensor kinase
MTSVIAGSYDYRLVALSFVIALLTSYTALDLAARVTANHGFHRVMWLLGGAFAMGSGIWCMHYTGMLAFRLPIPVYYHVPTVFVSLLAAIVASSIALYVVSRKLMTPTHLVAGSLLMGAAIATMHYTGMAAMRLGAMHYYDRNLWILSIFLAVMVSYAGLLIIYHSGGERYSWKYKAGAALSLGIAIPAMHYTGMAAVHFVLVAAPPNLAQSTDISTLAYLGILCVTFLVLGFALITSLVDRKLSAQQLMLESERKMLRALIDNIPDLMYVKDRESRFVIANPEAAHALGVNNPEELIGKTELDFIHSEQTNACYANEQSVMLSGRATFNSEEIVLDVLGDDIPVLRTTVPLRDSRGQITGIAGVGHNISERKKNEEALAAAERKYRGMFDEALFGMFQVDPDGNLLDLNQAMAHFMLYASAKEMLESQTAPFWTSGVLPERVAALLELMKEFGHVRAFEVEVFRKDRSKIWISTTVRAMVNKGEVTGFEGMFEDITERRQLRDQLLQAQKLESVGQLAAGIAHEINTPTQYIGDNLRFLKKTFASLSSLMALYGRLWDETCSDAVTTTSKQEMAAALHKTKVAFLMTEIPKAIDDGLEGTKRVSSLVSAMKEFSHPGTKEKVPLDLNHAIQSTITVAQNEWKYVAEMETEFEATLPHVFCLPGEFNQVILNLIVNAAHAIGDRVQERNGEKGKIRVRTARCESGVEIRIADTGGGIPLEVRAKIFDPFFTTKEIGKGTGQGLAIARSVIVDKHSGSIDFETVLGEGTTFIVRLPHVEKPQPAQVTSLQR